LNPVREAALRDFSAENILKRSGMGAAEGALGGLMGADTVNAIGRTGFGHWRRPSSLSLVYLGRYGLP